LQSQTGSLRSPFFSGLVSHAAKNFGQRPK